MIVDILSLFPEYFSGPFDVSMIKRAREKGILEIRHTDIREFSKDKHHRVDDRPYGGGPGMVLKPEPVFDAIAHVKKENSHVIYLSPQGCLLNARKCEQLSLMPHLILICGHYEGIDERIIENEIDEEISIGDYVLTNGCSAAIVLVDAVARFIPEVLGHPDAAKLDSFQNGIFDAPQYTKPLNFQGSSVPEVLTCGHHARIDEWRQQQALKKTLRVRPDLVKQTKK